MPKPCRDRHPEFVASCRVCWLARHDPRYRARWDIAGEPEAPAKAFDPDPPPGLGDEVEALIKSVGLDRLAKAYEAVTGQKCRCDQRKALLNRLPAVLPKIRALLGVPPPPHDAEVDP